MALLKLELINYIHSTKYNTYGNDKLISQKKNQVKKKLESLVEAKSRPKQKKRMLPWCENNRFISEEKQHWNGREVKPVFEVGKNF